MAIYRVGRTDLDLTVIGAGIRGGLLPEGPVVGSGEAVSPPLSDRERFDDVAFREAGWRFVAAEELNWAAVKALNPDGVDAGFLARHPRGGLVILPDRLVLGLGPGADAERRASLFRRYSTIRPLGYGVDLFEVQLELPDGGSFQETIQEELRFLHGQVVPGGVVAFAEPSLIYHFTHPGRLAVGPEVKPRGNPGPLDADDWHWQLIRLADAWSIDSTKGKGVRVAVIDFGFHLKDDQINRHVAWVARVRDNLKVSFDSGDLPEDPHGTLCASLIGAVLDKKSVNGAAPECELILVAVPATMPQAVLGAALALCAAGGGGRPGADVISCSLAPKDRNLEIGDPLRVAIDGALATGRPTTGPARGTLVVWAAGNPDKELDPDSVEGYEPVLSVSQCDKQGKRVESGYGDRLDLIAPGSGVNGIVYEAGISAVRPSSGSSLAAPCVAGVAALVLAVAPGLDWKGLTDVLSLSCDPQPPHGKPKVREPRDGWGRLNAWEALTRAKGQVPAVPRVTAATAGEDSEPAGPAKRLAPERWGRC